MRQKMQHLKQYFIVNKKLYLFLAILFVIAIISGSIFSITLNEIDNDLVTTYLENYLNLVKDKKIIFKESFINYFFSNSIINLIIWLLGFSVIGIPVIIFLFFYKCFIIGFATSSIILRYKSKGIILGVAYVCPHHIISILILMMLSIYALTLSINIIKAILKRKEITFKEITTRYSIILLLTFVINLLLGVYEAYLLPKILFLILTLI